MNYLHVAIIEHVELCFVSTSSDGLRSQVSEWLADHSLHVPTDEEWAICILADEARLSDEHKIIGSATPLLRPISYYKVESRLVD